MIDLELDEVPTESAASESAKATSGLDWACASAAIPGVRIGVLIGTTDNGITPLVIFPGQVGSAAVRARSTLHVRGEHVGRDIALMFENGDPRHPILMGLMARNDGWSSSDQSGKVEIDADGESLVVNAKEQLVLRCGSASITLTRSGKVLVQGTYISSRSSGVNRIKGGSVQLN
jgi:hypothetical protein